MLLQGRLPAPPPYHRATTRSYSPNLGYSSRRSYSYGGYSSDEYNGYESYGHYDDY
jgi:hypothetical protein